MNRNLIVIGVVVGFILWLGIVIGLIDPWLRSLVFRVWGIAIERSSPDDYRESMQANFHSKTPGRGGVLAVLWTGIFFLVLSLPLILTLTVMALRWSAEHRK